MRSGALVWLVKYQACIMQAPLHLHASALASAQMLQLRFGLYTMVILGRFGALSGRGPGGGSQRAELALNPVAAAHCTLRARSRVSETLEGFSSLRVQIGSEENP